MTAILGEVVTGQVIDVAAVTAMEVQLSLPLAPRVVVTAQVLAGTVKLPLKLADAPAARVPRLKIGLFRPGRSLTTTTLFKGMLPVFFTVPV